MKSAPISRRRFLGHGALWAGALWGPWWYPRPAAARAAAASDRPVVLDAREWRTVAAMAARILPSGADGPGAEQAGCVNFIDKALANEDARAVPLYRSGLAALEAHCRERYGTPFAELDASRQDARLRDLQDGRAEAWPGGGVAQQEFFETVRVHTILGFLADPRYGGNRDWAGWKLLGYPGGRHALGGYTPAQMLGKEPVRPVWEEAKPDS